MTNLQRTDLVKRALEMSAPSVSLSIPLFIRLLEVSREELKSDEDLHKMVEKVISASLHEKGRTLDMSFYEDIYTDANK